MISCDFYIYITYTKSALFVSPFLEIKPEEPITSQTNNFSGDIFDKLNKQN